MCVLYRPLYVDVVPPHLETSLAILVGVLVDEVQRGGLAPLQK